MASDLDIESLLDMAIVSHEARDLDRAESLYRDVLRAQPDHPEAMNLLGLILQDRGRPEESVALISRALESDPEFPDALANLARGLNFLGQSERAADAARRATELDPVLGEGWLQLGRALLSLGKYQEALAALCGALPYFVDSSELHAAIGFAAQSLGDAAAAIEAWRKVLDLQPDRVDAMINLGSAYCQTRQLDDALVLHRRAVARAPDNTSALGALAWSLHQRYEPAELVEVCRALLALEPERADILTLQGAGLMWLGRIDDAAASFQAALMAEPGYVSATQLLARVKPETMDSPTIARVSGQLDDTDLPVEDRVMAGFAAAIALDKAGDFDAAFHLYQSANALSHAQGEAAGKPFNPDEYKVYVDWARNAFVPSTFIEMRTAGNSSELPVFIVGMPRSGTSLVEQIAASHPKVFGGGELLDISEILARLNPSLGHRPPQRWDREQIGRETEQHVSHLRAMGGDAVRVIDKMPDNIKVLGQIRVLFPNSRIIVCRRDPRDICVSCFTTPFGEAFNWAWDIEDCAKVAVDTDHLLDIWRSVLPGPVLEISYEALVADMETESRRLIAFLGLDWDPACLMFHRTERPVTTASTLQVRQPIFTSSIGKWRRYEANLGPMLRILAENDSDGSVSRRWDGPEIHAWRNGMTALATGDLTSAIQILREATTLFPGEHDLLVGLGLTLGQHGDFEAAIDVWRQALALRPDQPRSLANLGLALIQVGRAEESVAQFRRAIALRPEDYEYHKALASAHWALRQTDAARDAWQRALALVPGEPDCLVGLGICAATLGHFEDAATLYREALSQQPTNTQAALALLEIGKTVEPGIVENLQAILFDPHKPEQERIWAGFALGKTLNAAKDYSGAIAAWHIANGIARDRKRRAGNIFNGPETRAWIDHLISRFSPAAFEATKDWGDPSELPVFIVGLPRSGTSLVEQIVASHPEVFGAGERSDIVPAIQALESGAAPEFPADWDPAVVRREGTAEVERLRTLGGDAARVTDKEPTNIYWLGHIRVMLPKARIIVCRRDPRDIGVSCYFADFLEEFAWPNDLRDIATQIRETDRIIAHWRSVLPGPLMEIQYENLVRNPEAEARRLVEFLGLPWDPRCLEFHATERLVTSSSFWQVRQKLYGSSIGRWRHYERHLGLLLDGLGGMISSTDAPRIDEEAPVD
jgi:tetratricopeptide (TPR) repeat protein